jgi:hypothetical protein
VIAVFVRGRVLGLLSGGGDDDTTDSNASNAASQVGGKPLVFPTQTVLGAANTTRAFNAAAPRFA